MLYAPSAMTVEGSAPAKPVCRTITYANRMRQIVTGASDLHSLRLDEERNVMNTQDRKKRHARAFSLVELLVVLGVIGTLSGLSAGVIIRVRQVSRGMTCANNLRQIATGLLTYYTEFNCTPSFSQGTLPVMLADVISEPNLFICPSSPYPTSDSYSQYYVPREPTAATGFLLGCPNHTAENSTFGSFGAGLTLKGKTEPVLWNNQPVAPGSAVSGGTLSFADGTTVAINSGVNVIVLVSFEEGQGRIYSAIKMPTGSVGTIQVQAAHGTHFDVATPACTAGVRGTQFSVTTSSTSQEYQTDVAVTEGTVWVDGVWPAPSTTTLPAGSSQSFILPLGPLAPPTSIVVNGPIFPGNNEVWYSVINSGNNPFTISQITLTWPTSSDQTLQHISLNGSAIFTQPFTTSPTIVSSGWSGSAADRTIGSGEGEMLVFSFQAGLADSDPANYSIGLQ